MACPHARGNLMRLPGKGKSDAARMLRKEMLAGSIDPEAFITLHRHAPKGPEAVWANQVAAYAAASIVIDSFWEFIQRFKIEEGLATLKKKYGKDDFDADIENFSECLNALIGQMQKRFIDGGRERHLKKEPRSVEDEQLLFFFAPMRHRARRMMPSGGKKLPFPSSKDLVMFVARMAQVAPKAFRRDVGREPSLEEVMGLLRHPELFRFCIEIMAADRTSTHPLIALLEGEPKGDLNDAKRHFDSKYFEIHECDGARTLRLNPGVVEGYLKHFERAARRRKKRGKPEPQALGCPALYGGKFNEMFDWAVDLLEAWLKANH